MQDEPGLKSKDSGLFSMDGESNSDNEDQSQGDPNGPPGKRRMRKIPKLPMVRHGKKWYRARLLKDSGQRVQIGTARRLPQVLFFDPPAPCCSGPSAAILMSFRLATRRRRHIGGGLSSCIRMLLIYHLVGP